MISDEKLDALIEAIENLIENMDDLKRGSRGTWDGGEGLPASRQQLKEALKACLDPSQNG